MRQLDKKIYYTLQKNKAHIKKRRSFGRRSDHSPSLTSRLVYLPFEFRTSRYSTNPTCRCTAAGASVCVPLIVYGRQKKKDVIKIRLYTRGRFREVWLQSLRGRHTMCRGFLPLAGCPGSGGFFVCASQVVNTERRLIVPRGGHTFSAHSLVSWGFVVWFFFVFKKGKN